MSKRHPWWQNDRHGDSEAYCPDCESMDKCIAVMRAKLDAARNYTKHRSRSNFEALVKALQD